MSQHTLGFEVEEVSPPILYFLMIKPDQTGWELMMNLKREFDEYFPSHGAVNLRPHVTIFQDKIPFLSEETIVNKIESAASEIAPFEFTFNGILPISTTLWMDLDSHGGFEQILSALKSRMKVKFSSRPHLSIARHLTPDVLQKSFDHFADREIKHSFKVEKLLLLKGPGGKNNSEVKEFQFGG